MTSRALTPAERERRTPVWIALSTLWLDTELDAGDIGGIAEVLRASGYPLATLRDIYRLEVAPVVAGNLHTPAGVWDGFDAAWLCAKAAARAARIGRWSRLWANSPPGRWYLTYATDAHWRAIEARLADATAGEATRNGPT